MSWLGRLFRRRSKRGGARDEPFPGPWLRILEAEVPSYRRLPGDQQADLRRDIRHFIAEKKFTGTEGLTVTNEMKVVIAAHACLLILRLPAAGIYRRTREIIIRPREFGETTTAVGPDGRRYEIRSDRIGEAWYRGPVVLAWDSIKRLARTSFTGRNVVIHEFAHKLDFLDGYINGTPPLGTRARLADWVRVFTQEYETLVAQAHSGRRSFLDGYGATNPAEFFAVASEAFFEQPHELKERHRELYRQLQDFYRQDPATWAERAAEDEASALGR